MILTKGFEMTQAIQNIFKLSCTAILTLGMVTVEAKEKKVTSSEKTNPPSMKVLTIKDQPSTLAPSENFTGTVRVTRLIEGEDPSDLTCGCVEFQPGAHSNWHTHPKGQLLIVTEGTGLVQEWGKPVRKIQKGDVIWTPPGVKHWHGAAPNTSMTHMAVTETLNGKAVDWLERVTDETYKTSPQ